MTDTIELSADEYREYRIKELARENSMKELLFEAARRLELYPDLSSNPNVTTHDLAALVVEIEDAKEREAIE